MSDVGNAINQIRAALSAAAPAFMADTCDVFLLTPGPDDYGGSTNTSSTVASSVPCDYEALSPFQTEIGGRLITGRTHKITLPSNATTEAILPKHKIVVAARGNTPALTFNDPIVLPDSLSPFLEVAATLAVQ